jgi:hypothetical protein
MVHPASVGTWFARMICRIADKEGNLMLEQTAPEQSEAAQESQKDKEVVTCFVCKQNVSRSQARQLVHPKEKKVWVCEGHIRQ